MPVKLRLKRQGRRKAPHYAIVAADARAPRDGRFIEKIGTYDPVKEPAHLYVDEDAAVRWLGNGAQPTRTVRHLLRHAGVTVKYALIKQGKSEEEIERIYGRWLEEKRKRKKKKMIMVDREGKLLEEMPEKATPAPTAKKKEEDAKEAIAPEAVQGDVAEAGEVVEGKTEAPDAPAPQEETPQAEEKLEAAAPIVEAETEPPAIEADDLSKVEGIGPKINEVLQAAGITTFAQLAEKKPEDIKAILEGAEGNFAAHDPATWPEQAQFAAEGKWDELKKWQDELDGGRK